MFLTRSLEKLCLFGNTEFMLNLVLLISGILVSYFAYEKLKKIWLINKIPGPKGHFIFGNILDVNGSESEKFKTITGKFCDYGDAIGLSRVWIGLKPRCYIHKAEVAEQLLKSRTHISKGLAYEYAYPWLGKGILTSTGDRWHRRRKMLTPAFHFQVLDDFFEVFSKQAVKFVENLEPKANGEAFDLLECITLSMLNSLFETVTGKSLDYEGDSESKYLKALITMQNIVLKRIMVPWMQPNFLFKLLGYKKLQDETLKILNDFTDETIRQKREEQKRLSSVSANEIEQKKRTKSSMSFLDIILESYDKKTIPDLDIREEVNTLMFGGHDTTSTSVFWTIYLLGANKKKQEKLVEEMDNIFGDSKRLATIEDIRKMKYLECCFKEALRLLPTVPAVGRVLEEDATLGNHKIPAGTTIITMIYRLHRDPEHFPDPEVYQPERFFPENSLNRHPYAYVPFSAGPRNCIGQKFAILEAKTYLSTFFRNYWVESTVKFEDLQLSKGFVLKSEQKDIVKITKRK